MAEAYARAEGLYNAKLTFIKAYKKMFFVSTNIAKKIRYGRSA